MRFLVDAQLPPALARLLETRGHQAEHVPDIAPGNTPDSDLWDYAIEHAAVIVIKDEDFLLQTGRTPPPRHRRRPPRPARP